MFKSNCKRCFLDRGLNDSVTSTFKGHVEMELKHTLKPKCKRASKKNKRGVKEPFKVEI